MRGSAWVVVATAVLSAAAACAARTRAAAPVETPAGMRFVVELPAARSVALAGSFNDWSTSSHPLVRERASGLWTIVVAVPPGEHTFMYLVNGAQWITPPDAEEYADDGFGAKNGVLIVRPKER